MAANDEQPKESREGRQSNLALEWVRVLLPAIISWPAAGLVIAVLFHDSLSGLINRFSQSAEGKAELGPLKIQLGTPVLPPQYRSQAPKLPKETIDLSSNIGRIGDTGPEGTTVGFALAYAIQSAAAAKGQRGLEASPRGIYVLAKKYDEFPGEDYEGTSLLGALQGAKDIGVYSASDWPYSSKALPRSSAKPVLKLRGFKQAKSISQILDALRAGSVVAASIQVTSDFDTPGKDGRVTIKLPLRELGAKTIAIVGYDASAAEFKFANDWGTSWGAQGFGIIKDTDLSKVLLDGYSVDL